MKKVVFTFGRMNPITKGHQRLVRKVKDLAKKDRADAHVYLSHTQDSKKNPLSYKQKIGYAKSAFGSIVKQSNDKTVINILKSLQKNYSDVVMVVGSDRVNEFKKLLDKYNGKDFKFDTVDVVSSGNRDPDADGVEGMSASKMRELAKQDNYVDFKMGLPNLREPKMKQIFTDVRKGMKLEELEKELDTLCDIAKREAEIEKRQEETNLKAFESRIDEALSLGAENREAAIKWILQAEGLDKEQDSGYICYTLGLSYDKEHLFQTKH